MSSVDVCPSESCFAMQRRFIGCPILVFLLALFLLVSDVAIYPENSRYDEFKSIQQKYVTHLKSVLGKSDHVASPYRGEAYDPGATAILALALIQAESLDKAELSRVTKYCAEAVEKDELVFNLSFSALFLSRDAKQKANKIIADKLCGAIQATGMWQYSVTGSVDEENSTGGDNSVTLFAVIALDTLVKIGCKVPVEVWEKCLKHFESTQNKDGGWGYVPGGRSTPAMTAAGLVCSFLCHFHLYADKPLSGRTKDMPFVFNAVDWLDGNSDIESNPRFPLYGLYAAVKLAEVTGYHRFAKGDTIGQAARILVSKDIGKLNSVDASFSLLAANYLLRKPIVAKYLCDERKLPCEPHDCRNVVDNVEGRKYRWSTIGRNHIPESENSFPMLYISGSSAFDLADDELKWLTEYCKTGLLVGHAENGNADFDKSFRALLKKIMPDVVLDKADAKHRIFISPNRIDPKEMYPVEIGLDPMTYRQKVIYVTSGDFGGNLGISKQPGRAMRLMENIIAQAIPE